MATRLKLYDADADDCGWAPEPNVRIRLGDLLPIIAMANRRNFLWLKDFLDDEVVVTDDLYDVIQNFRAVRPGA